MMPWKRHLPKTDDLYPELKQIEDKRETKEFFNGKLTFGTAGIRGKMGVGTNRLNKDTVRKVMQGLIIHLNANYPNMEQKKVVIAYDTRHNSKQFAQEAACMLAYSGYSVYLPPTVKPTPYLSFVVRYLKANAGIMITASHNPPEYNGIKVYSKDGGQILPEETRQISDKIAKVEHGFSVKLVSYDKAVQMGKIQFLSEKVDQAYIRSVLSLSHDDTHSKSLKVVYTPLHGSGTELIKTVLKKAGYDQTIYVAEQETLDPKFSTVTSPNPEDKSSFALGLKYAQAEGAELIIATDPDVDRVGVMVKEGGKFIHLTGNELGALLFNYLIQRKIELNRLPKEPVLIKTIVSTDLVNPIAAKNEIKIVQKLTGFKYINEGINQVLERYETFFFGFEESCGYLVGDFVRDKDAIQATLMICEMAEYYKSMGKTLIQVLNELYKEYGYYLTETMSYSVDELFDKGQIEDIIDYLCSIKQLSSNYFRITKKIDYRRGIDGFPKADVVKIWINGDSWFVLRPSGTEPKIKLYLSVVDKKKEDAIRKMEELRDFVLSFLSILPVNFTNKEK